MLISESAERGVQSVPGYLGRGWLPLYSGLPMVFVKNFNAS